MKKLIVQNRTVLDEARKKTILFEDPKGDKSPFKLLSFLGQKGNTVKELYERAAKINKITWPDGNDLPVRIKEDFLEDLIKYLPGLKRVIIKALRIYFVIPDFYKNIGKIVTNFREAVKAL